MHRRQLRRPRRSRRRDGRSTKVKLYIFTVQALLEAPTKTGRKTHKFQEGLGKALYEHLQALPRTWSSSRTSTLLLRAGVLARGPRPPPAGCSIGLTATPDPKTPKEQIIFRYPLAAAIADRLVKTPVIVGRKDDHTDRTTKLLDGVRLVEAKQKTLDGYCKRSKPVEAR